MSDLTGKPPTTTLAYTPGTKPVADTIVTPEPAATIPVTAAATMSVAPAMRSTVLPRMVDIRGTRQVVVDGKPRYEHLRPLGAGGQAEVTLVRDHDIDRTVALKRLLPERNDDGSVLRFAEEVRTVGQLEHPNIVPIHDVGVDEDGHYFFVMKYVEGETLESVIGKLRAGDPAYVARYTAQQRMQICNEILRGVQHAHELGILHRDLKPANVMIGSLGEVVVMDWGLAKRVADGESPTSPMPNTTPRTTTDRLFETHDGALLGTPAYMSPEQASGHLDQIDERSDVYSLSVMFYELFCLTHPRAHATSVAEMIAAVSQEPIGLVQVLTDFARVGAPTTMAHFVRHGLERDPKKRYQSVAAMRARLQEASNGKAPIECHVTFAQYLLQVVSRGVDRHPLVLLLFFILVGVGGLGGAGALVYKLVH